MNIFCPNPPGLCEDEALPNANYSSEAPDQQAFYGRNYGTGMEPPLGSRWTSSGCIGLCTSFESQEDADLCAARQAVSCRSTEWPVLEPNPNPEQPNQPFIPVDRQLFGNDPQECSYPCPDGTLFTEQIPADTVLQFSQAAADAIARSLACNQAIRDHVCIGDVDPDNGCVGTDYSGTVVVSGGNSPYTISIVSGSLPPGIAYTVQNATTAFFIGIPTATGTHTFRLRAQDASGNFMEKDLTIDVAQISPDSLSDPSFGVPYNQTVSALGPTEPDVVWSVVDGALPTGLTLNASTGAITGTPSAEGTFTFTIQMEDGQ